MLSYDNRLQTFPGNVVARAGSFEPREYFETDEGSLGPVTVEF